MRKVVLAMFTSLDGFIEGPNKRLIGPKFSADVDRYWIKPNTDNADVMMYGRVSYEGMAAYWTSKEAAGPLATGLAQKNKIVFSTTLRKADWANTTIVREDIAGTVNRLRQESGDGELILLGGAGIANAFMRLGLIDEYRVLVSPVVFGGGTPLFQGGAQIKLALDNARTLDTGAVLLTYRKA